ncbi:MAG: hypothetical protein E7238_00400 [Sarcina sp.]|nr:hypothetical protein [Sarcina sp.]
MENNGTEPSLKNMKRLEEALLSFIEREAKEPSSEASYEAIPKTAEVLLRLWKSMDVNLLMTN